MLVLFHSGCRDGYTAAHLMRHPLFFPPSEVAAMEFIGVNYGYEPPDCTDRDVWVLDFCYAPAQLTAMAAQARSVTVVDHHKTAIEALAGYTCPPNVTLHLSTNYSGAMLTWMVLADKWNVRPGTRPPRIVEFVQDRDLWRWQLTHSKAINAILQSTPLTWENWDHLTAELDIDGGLAMRVGQGQAILQYQATVVAEHVPFAREVVIGGVKGLATNATVLQSEIGEALALKAGPEGFGAVFTVKMDGGKIWSLRSPTTDVGALAKLYGGGGHKAAAGFNEAPGMLRQEGDTL